MTEPDMPEADMPVTADDDEDQNPLKCRWCKVVFKNKGNLAAHAYHMHGDNRYQNEKSQHKCNICNINFAQKYQLLYHIRRQHYNLHSKQPYCDLKKVNQVWFEKVLNSNAIVEIKKPQPNMLLIRKLDDNTSIKVIENATEVVDLHELYPTGRPQGTVECKICLKRYKKLDLKKHVEEIHYNIVKHRCNNCNLTFKRSYQYIKHVCHKHRKRKARGVIKEFDKSFKISSVESLSVPL